VKIRLRRFVKQSWLVMVVVIVVVVVGILVAHKLKNK
jgi:hypothetical protein